MAKFLVVVESPTKVKALKKYLGKDIYPFRKPDEVRVIYKVEPQRVLTYGG